MSSTAGEVENRKGENEIPLSAYPMAAVIGVTASALGALFLVTVHQLERLVWHTLPDTIGTDRAAPWWVIGMLLIGAVLAGLALRMKGHGGHSALHGLALDPDLSALPSVLLAALASLAFGAVLGPEAPLLAIGAAFGAWVGRSRPEAAQLFVLVAVAGTIAAIFGNPLIAVVMLLEIAVVSGMSRAAAVLPVLLVSVASAYVVYIGVGDFGGLGQVVLSVPGTPAYGGLKVVDVLLAVAVATVTVAVVLATRAGGRRVAHLAERFAFPVIIGAALIIAAMALIADRLAEGSIDLVLFSGQAALADVVSGLPVATLVIVLGLKAIAYAVSLGSGFRGGAIFPAVFLGVVVAAVAAGLFSDGSVSAYAAAGIAAATVATCRLVLLGVIMGVLLLSTAGPAITVTAIVGAVTAHVLMQALDRITALRKVASDSGDPALPVRN
jgi:H+/Cl- antiporter ClcA